jgi:hypothetical protein
MRKKFMSLCMGVLLGAGVPLAHADVEVAELPKALDSFKVGLELNTFYRVDSNPYFGGSRATVAGVPSSTIDDAHWGEIFAKMRFTAGKNFGWADGLAQFAPYFAGTVDQDAYGCATDPTAYSVDQAWIELAKLFGRPVGVRVGKQDVQIEKWFLVAHGDAQTAANWLFYHYSFPFAVQANADFSPFKATAFWARPGILPDGSFASIQTGDVDLLGINLHYDLMKDTYVYGGFYHTIDSTNDVSNNINAWDIGGQLKLMDALTLEGEFVYETGKKNGTQDRKGKAGWASVGYSFPVTYSPYVRGTYVYYSGDKDPTDTTSDYEGFDPMYAGFIGWNRWIQGEQTGELWLGKTNKKVAIAEAGFAPLPPMTISLMYLNHRIAEKESFGTTSSKWGDEVNLFMDYQINDQLFLHLGTGMMKPGDAAKEVAGDDKNAYFGQVWLKFAI